MTAAPMLNLGELITAALAHEPRTPAIQFRGAWRDWGWMRGVADAVDQALTAAGIQPDDPVGFIPRNRPEYAAALLALLAADRHVVMIYAYQSHEAMARRIEELHLPAIVAGAQDWVAATAAGGKAVGAAGVAVAIDGAVTAVEGLSLRRDAETARSPAARGVTMLTSGTTGSPKHFHMSYDKIRRSMITESSVTATQVEPIPILHYFPFGNIAGIYSYLPLAVAARPIIMIEKFALADWLDHIRRYPSASSSVPPAVFRMILEQKVPREALAGLKYMNTGAATLDPTVRAEFEQVYGIPVLQSYGATEFGGVVSLMTPDDRMRWPDKVDSVGRPWAGAQFRILDPDTGEPLPAGQEGRLEVISPRMGQDWITTTDLAMIDGEGFLYHRGRLDGAIMRGGFKIVPDTVAEVLGAHPAVAAVAVVGKVDARLGHAPVAAYELRAGFAEPSFADLDAHVRSRLPATYAPVDYLRVAELPRTPSLKIDSAAVRRLFEVKA